MLLVTSLLVITIMDRDDRMHPKHNRIEDIVRIPVLTASNKAVAATILEGNLTIPDNLSFVKGIIIFVFGSSDARHSPENRFIAQALNKEGLATLLVDLLSKEEEETDIRTEKIRCKLPGLIQNKSNIKLLSDRLIKITDWLLTTTYYETHGFIMGFFGAGTGAAAALIAASERPTVMGAVVSSSGSLDLVSEVVLMNIKVPTLLIVGRNDDKNLIGINNNTIKQLCNVEKKKFVVVPGAPSLSEDPGALENVARLASGWFRCYFLIKKHSNDNQK
jgi:putative phosphoribosyl transferase